HDVAAPESTGLLCEAVEPLEPGALHPGRRLTEQSGVIIECRAERDHGHAERVPVLEGEDLLARAAESDECDACAGIADPAHDRALLRWRDRAEERGLRASDHDTRHARAQIAFEAVQ